MADHLQVQCLRNKKFTNISVAVIVAVSTTTAYFILSGYTSVIIQIRTNLIYNKSIVSSKNLNQSIPNTNEHRDVKTEGTLWTKYVLKRNNSVIFNGGHALTAEKLKNITISITDRCSQQRFLVYKCDSSKLCGGWGDRQKGIVSTFLLALLTNRVFVIDMDKPCKLDNILLPNIYNWTACYNYVKNVPSKNLAETNLIDTRDKINRIQHFDFDKMWTQHVMVARMNIYAINEIRQHVHAETRLKWLLNITNEEAMHLALNTLFKPTERILKDAIIFYDNEIMGRRLICGHIRTGKNPSIPDDAKLRYGVPNTTQALDFLKEFENEDNAIYVASDSEEVKQLARENIKSSININRTIVHVDRLGKFKRLQSEACEGLATVILEQFILSLCDTLFFSRSGLSVIAAYIRGLDDNLFIFHPIKRSIVKATLADLQRIFNFL